MISKTHLIDSIRQINHSASAGWLDRFDVSTLRSYLDRLQLTLQPRGRSSVWTRPAAGGAIVTRRARG